MIMGMVTITDYYTKDRNYKVFVSLMKLVRRQFRTSSTGNCVGWPILGVVVTTVCLSPCKWLMVPLLLNRIDVTGTKVCDMYRIVCRIEVGWSSCMTRLCVSYIHTCHYPGWDYFSSP